jgi:hypothetical protein
MTIAAPRMRRVLALSATGVLTAGLALLPAGPSSAAVAARWTSRWERGCT